MGDLFLLLWGFRHCESGTRQRRRKEQENCCQSKRYSTKLCKQKSYSANTYLRQAPRVPGVLSHQSIFCSRGRLYRMKGSDFLIFLENGATFFSSHFFQFAFFLKKGLKTKRIQIHFFFLQPLPHPYFFWGQHFFKKSHFCLQIFPFGLFFSPSSDTP